jgi:hypothetical protein
MVQSDAVMVAQDIAGHRVPIHLGIPEALDSPCHRWRLAWPIRAAPNTAAHLARPTAGRQPARLRDLPGVRLRGGGYTHFWVLDQWRGKTIARRNKNAWTPEQIRRFHIMPTDDAYQ